jgi:hypothetical protein
VIGTGDNKKTNAVPLLAVGQITAGNDAALNVDQTYTLNVIQGPRRTGAKTPIMNPVDGTPIFTKPQDNVGNKTFPDYDAYANQYLYEIALPATGFFELATEPATGPVWQNLDPARFIAATGVPVMPVMIEATAAPIGSEGDDGLVRDWPAPDFGVDKHRIYSVQWYSFAGLAIVRRRRQLRRAAGIAK